MAKNKSAVAYSPSYLTQCKIKAGTAQIILSFHMNL